MKGINLGLHVRRHVDLTLVRVARAWAVWTHVRVVQTGVKFTLTIRIICNINN